MNKNTNQILIIGHRGAYKYPPENTLKSFQKAIQLGADYMEFDLHHSKDGEMIIMHDDDTFRTTGVRGLIKDMTLKELKMLDCGGGEKIPTLQELIKIAKRKIGLFCEIKAVGFEEKLVEILTQNNLLESTIIDSFFIDNLLKIQELEPTLQLGLVIPKDESFISDWNRRKDLIHIIIKNHFSHVVTRFKNVDQKLIDFAHQNKLKVIVYPVNSKLIMKKYINMGVDGMIVNDIRKAKMELQNYRK